MTRVLAVTTSMGTKWEGYSQALLAHHVPEWDRLVVDGRTNWTPTGFIDRVIDTKADYLVHVDEDCFVESRQALLALIAEFDKNEQLVAAGLPDGGHYYRQHNPAALNLFFVVFRMDALRQAWVQKPHWGEQRFRPEFSREVVRQCPSLDTSRISWDDEAEPYYPLFWSLLSFGGQFMYLGERLDRSRWSTHILNRSGNLIAEHLWYLRQWFSESAMPGHDCANVLRYEMFKRELMSRPESGVGFRSLLACMHMRRLTRRILR